LNRRGNVKIDICLYVWTGGLSASINN